MKHFIFGYGSLINRESRLRTANTGEAIPVRVKGLQRAWNFYSKARQRTALGVIINPGAICNGVIIEVPEENLAAFDSREEGYDRIKVEQNKVEVLKGEFPVGTIWVYVPKESILSTKDSPIEQSYIDVVLTGCLEFSEDFAEEFIVSTLCWGYAWVNDRKFPMYERYISNPPLEQIDKHLNELVPEALVKRINL